MFLKLAIRELKQCFEQAKPSTRNTTAERAVASRENCKNVFLFFSATHACRHARFPSRAFATCLEQNVVCSSSSRTERRLIAESARELKRRRKQKTEGALLSEVYRTRLLLESRRKNEGRARTTSTKKMDAASCRRPTLLFSLSLFGLPISPSLSLSSLSPLHPPWHIALVSDIDSHKAIASTATLPLSSSEARKPTKTISWSAKKKNVLLARSSSSASSSAAGVAPRFGLALQEMDGKH